MRAFHVVIRCESPENDANSMHAGPHVFLGGGASTRENERHDERESEREGKGDGERKEREGDSKS